MMHLKVSDVTRLCAIERHWGRIALFVNWASQLSQSIEPVNWAGMIVQAGNRKAYKEKWEKLDFSHLANQLYYFYYMFFLLLLSNEIYVPRS